MMHTTILLALAMGADLPTDYADRVKILRGSWRMETTITGPGKTIRQIQKVRFWDEGRLLKIELTQSKDGKPLETHIETGSYEALLGSTRLHFLIDVPEGAKAEIDPDKGILCSWERHWHYHDGEKEVGGENVAVMKVLEWGYAGGIPFAKRAVVDWQIGKDVARHDEITFDLHALVPWTAYLWIAGVVLFLLGVLAWRMGRKLA